MQLVQIQTLRRLDASKVSKLLEYLPLSGFLIFAQIFNSRDTHNWKEPFFIGGALALLSIVVVIWKEARFDRVLLGINLYLFAGCAAILVHFRWLLELYMKMMSAGMLAWVVIVGILTLFFSKEGFVGLACANKALVRKYSAYLLMIVLIAFCTAFVFQGRPYLSEVAPYGIVFISQLLFKLNHYNIDPKNDRV